MFDVIRAIPEAILKLPFNIYGLVRVTYQFWKEDGPVAALKFLGKQVGWIVGTAVFCGLLTAALTALVSLLGPIVMGCVGAAVGAALGSLLGVLSEIP